MKLAFIWTTSCDVLTPNVTSLGMVVREARAPIMIKVVTVFSARVEEESVVSPYVVVKPRLARKRVCAAIYTSLLWQGDDRPKATSCRRHRRNFNHEFWRQHKTKTWPFSCFRQCIRPIKRIVLFPVHLKQFSWVGRKVFYFSFYIVLPVKFMVFEEKIRI